MLVPGGEIYVIDTSSVINVKELIEPNSRNLVLKELSKQCQQETLVYPPEVLKELRSGVKHGKSDPPFTWAKENETVGCRFGSCHAELKIVMNHPVAKLTPDPDQTDGDEDADPFVLATALHLDSIGLKPLIVTQESKKTPPQVPLNIAAGALGLPSIHLYALLLRIGIWTDDLRNSN